jgi:hypothetical protein
MIESALTDSSPDVWDDAHDDCDDTTPSAVADEDVRSAHSLATL